MSPHIYTMSDRWPLHLKEDHEVISILRSLLTDNSPKPGKVGQTTGVFVPYPFRIMVWVLLRPTRTRSGKVLWDGTYGFSSLSEKNRKSKPFADVIAKELLSSQLFKDPEFWSGRGLNPRSSAQQTGTLPTDPILVSVLTGFHCNFSLGGKLFGLGEG